MSPFAFETTVDDVAAALDSQIRGRNVIITGTSPGSLACEAAKAIAGRHPGLLVLTARKLSLLEETKAAILLQSPDVKIKLLEFDLSSQESVRNAATSLTNEENKFDVLINSAGIMASPYAQTSEGIESQFGINHIGPFLFTNLLIPVLDDGATIVNVTSRGYQMGPIQWDDLNFEHTEYNKWQAYAQSKAANILFSASLARKLQHKAITSFSVHPGSIFTNLGRHLTQEDYDMLSGIPMQYKNPQQGAANMVIAAFDPSIRGGPFLRVQDTLPRLTELLAHNGGHIDDDCQVKPIPEAFAYAIGIDNEDRLWELSEKLVKQKFSY
ncbi:hypothetical protein BJY04DRAFT_212272 [Aspergillus karnatakaensis]|uniref:uncharacterized protein n=1 Tax=Aspergillus karnatakaensis TaxID=1810916 RepID=UPI003CCE2346